MNIEFNNEFLFDYFTLNYSGKHKYSESVLRNYRKVIIIFKETEQFGELRKLHGLKVGIYNKHWSARINDQWRLEFDFIKPNTLRILNISKHYEK